MAATSEARALPFFTDLYGSPLESGFIYIGQAGLDPVAYPAVVTSDIAGSVVVAQPIRTTHGHATAAGSLIHLFVEIPYSITILDAARRLVYASLNETDPIVMAIGSSSVQSVANAAELRARDKNSTNQVWMTDVGMYTYVPTDNTSPENFPFVVVGNDGGRYHLNLQDVNANWVKVTGNSNPSTQGLWIGWNAAGDGSAFITNNRGISTGGIVIRVVNADNSVETGRATITTTGGLVTTDGIQATGDIKATHNLIAMNSVVELNNIGTRSILWDSVGDTYALPNAPLLVNGSLALTTATYQSFIAANQLANGIGAVALGNNIAPNPVLPGTWVSPGTGANAVFLWVRTA
ncbi:Phage tail fibers [Caballeronia glathei]|uniref:Uncharacterized protein n=1 Tax=Caballeronia glathei TaxID=60547 RepID=A0A069PEX7_9BURK|nr:hypothetical protein [Caballeronia glathei]KDR39198.1 hypothetical protein BG61_34150 [Caballeronia glathei]CDY76100.1 Phage tail fibers [Caballeronia glathei]